VAPPTGWTYDREPGRFRMFAPLGWEVRHNGTATSLHERTGPKIITVDRWPAPPEGSLAAAQARSRAWTMGTAGAPADYALVNLAPLGYFAQGLEWEYTHSDASTGLTRTVSRWFIDEGYCYSLSVTLPAYDALGKTSYMQVLVGGFRPSRLS
jgi:hypothetical protein